jgi:hypothetical protein
VELCDLSRTRTSTRWSTFDGDYVLSSQLHLCARLMPDPETSQAWQDELRRRYDEQQEKDRPQLEAAMALLKAGGWA